MINTIRRTINEHTELPQSDEIVNTWTTREHYSRLTKEVKGKQILQAMISSCILETQAFLKKLNKNECKEEWDAMKKVTKTTKELDNTAPENTAKIDDLEKTLNDNLMDLQIIRDRKNKERQLTNQAAWNKSSRGTNHDITQVRTVSL